MKSFKFYLLVAVVFLYSNNNVVAQDPPIPFECPDPFTPCPIDGGVSLLIAAGIGLAAKKAHMERNKKKLSVEENSK